MHYISQTCRRKLSHALARINQKIGLVFGPAFGVSHDDPSFGVGFCLATYDVVAW